MTINVYGMNILGLNYVSFLEVKSCHNTHG